MVNILYSIILGLVQGVSEWLPISSKTQVLLASTLLFSLPVSAAYAFGLFMEIGSLGSATAYFRHDVWSLFHDRRLLRYLALVTVVTGLVGLPLYYVTDKVLQSSPYNIGIPMIILGLVLVGVGLYIRRSRSNPRMNGLEQLRTRDLVLVGIAQGIAALPGVSRSGMTVSTMLLLGVKPDQAFRLSYLAYIPASLGAFGASVLLSRDQIELAVQTVEPSGIAVAIITALVVGILVIGYLLNFAKRNDIWVVDLALGIVALGIGVVVSVLGPLVSGSFAFS